MTDGDEIREARELLEQRDVQVPVIQPDGSIALRSGREMMAEMDAEADDLQRAVTLLAAGSMH